MLFIVLSIPWLGNEYLDEGTRFELKNRSKNTRSTGVCPQSYMLLVNDVLAVTPGLRMASQDVSNRAYRQAALPRREFRDIDQRTCAGSSHMECQYEFKKSTAFAT